MSTEFTPTTDSVKRVYAAAFKNPDQFSEAFERWLASVVHEAKAEAWTEGYYKGDVEGYWGTRPRTTNPYEEEK